MSIIEKVPDRCSSPFLGLIKKSIFILVISLSIGIRKTLLTVDNLLMLPEAVDSKII